jgi:uncharacterized membrane protein
MTADLGVALAFVAALGSGLIAGLFFAFSVSVMRALARLPENQGIAAMQAINVAILNPVFLVVFFGTAAASAISLIASLLAWQAPRALWLLVAGVFYLLGSFLVTIWFNVPLNKALASVPAEGPEASRLWARYLSRWTAWNHVRTILSLAATAAFILASR